MDKVSVELRINYTEMDLEGRESWQSTTVEIEEDQLRKLISAMEDIEDG